MIDDTQRQNFIVQATIQFGEKILFRDDRTSSTRSPSDVCDKVYELLDAVNQHERARDKESLVQFLDETISALDAQHKDRATLRAGANIAQVIMHNASQPRFQQFTVFLAFGLQVQAYIQKITPAGVDEQFNRNVRQWCDQVRQAFRDGKENNMLSFGDVKVSGLIL